MSSSSILNEDSTLGTSLGGLSNSGFRSRDDLGHLDEGKTPFIKFEDGRKDLVAKGIAAATGRIDADPHSRFPLSVGGQMVHIFRFSEPDRESRIRGRAPS
jgi:hypothetical protein